MSAAEVCGADRLLDDQALTFEEARAGGREAEGEQQPEHAEDRALDGSDLRARERVALLRVSSAAPEARLERKGQQA
ncbi:MAG TPA: hypothetical protein VMS55_05895 [Myxococcota bacterium]|nr:hypothetical protein [Myxococcota bacterium]